MTTENHPGADPTAAELQFGDVLRKAGFVIDQGATMDGEWHRVPVDGDKGKQTSGSYRGFLDGKRPAGVYRNFKSNGGPVNWKYDGETAELTGEDRVRIEDNRREREAAQQRQYEERAAYTASQVPKLAPAAADNPYLVRKQVQSHGLLQDRHGNLVMPLSDVDGKLWSVQRIKPDGEKIFTKDARTHGLFFQLGADDPSKPNIVVEGYATAATVHELTGLPVKVALNAGNLRAVAFALSMVEPNRPIIVSGDNDHEKEGQINPKTNQPYVNVGKVASQEAADFIGNQVRVALVQFEQGQEGTDWNDLAVNYGRDIARKQMEVAFGREHMVGERPAQQDTLDAGHHDRETEKWRPASALQKGNVFLEEIDGRVSPQEVSGVVIRGEGFAHIRVVDGQLPYIVAEDEPMRVATPQEREAIREHGVEAVQHVRQEFEAMNQDAAARIAPAVAEDTPEYSDAGASEIPQLDPSRFSSVVLSGELEAMDARIREVAAQGRSLSTRDREAVVATAEASIAKVDAFAAGSDRLASALNAIPEPHQRAAMGLARTLATVDAPDKGANPFANERLKSAYQNERVFQERVARVRGLDEYLKENPRPAPPTNEEIIQQRLERVRGLHERAGFNVSSTKTERLSTSRPVPTAQDGTPPQVDVAQTFLNSNDVITRRKATEAHPGLRNAFALEAALSKFAEETLPPVMAVRFMAAQKDLIAGKLRSGAEIPTVMVREQQEPVHGEAEH